MKKTTIMLALSALALTVGIGSANAALIDAPVPSDAYITYAGIEWAWGGACPYSGGCFATGDLSYQSTQGWSLPSAADLALVDAADAVDPSTFANLFFGPSGNVPAGGTDPVSGAFFAQGFEGGSCASPYFDTAVPWCDDADGLNGLWAGSAIGSGVSYDEQLYVKGAVPEASTWALMLIGFVGVGSMARRRKAVSAA